MLRDFAAWMKNPWNVMFRLATILLLTLVISQNFTGTSNSRSRLHDVSAIATKYPTDSTLQLIPLLASSSNESSKEKFYLFEPKIQSVSRDSHWAIPVQNGSHEAVPIKPVKIAFWRSAFLAGQTDCTWQAEVSAQYRLVILVESRVESLRKRQIIRQTWGSIRQYQNFSIELKFFMGRFTRRPTRRYSISNPEESLMEESRLYKDIILIDLPSAVTNDDRLLCLGALHWANRFCRTAAMFLKVKDSTFVNVYRLIKVLHATETQKPGFVCSSFSFSTSSGSRIPFEPSSSFPTMNSTAVSTPVPTQNASSSGPSSPFAEHDLVRHCTDTAYLGRVRVLNAVLKLADIWSARLPREEFYITGKLRVQRKLGIISLGNEELPKETKSRGIQSRTDAIVLKYKWLLFVKDIVKEETSRIMWTLSQKEKQLHG